MTAKEAADAAVLAAKAFVTSATMHVGSAKDEADDAATSATNAAAAQVAAELAADEAAWAA